MEAVYRFRYEIYVEEMGRRQKDADHARRRIEDRYDQHGVNLCAFDRDRVIGVMRMNFGSDASLGGYESFYDIAGAGNACPRQSGIATRFMVASDVRKGRLAVDIMSGAFHLSLERRIDYCFMDCNDHLVDFFTKVGFVEYAPVKTHPEYGDVHLMRFDLRDPRHLRASWSPFREAWLRYTADLRARESEAEPLMANEVAYA
jgi:predicted GNAT family N-acyltransferase